MPTMTRSSASIDDLLLDAPSRSDASGATATPARASALAARRYTPYRLHSAMVVCTACGEATVNGACGCTRSAWPRLEIEMGQRVPMFCAALLAFAFLARVFAMFLS